MRWRALLRPCAHRCRFPAVTFGRTSVFDWSTSTEDGLEHLVTLHIWSKAKGKEEAFAILDAVRAALGTPLSLDGQHLVNFRFEFAEVTFDDDISNPPRPAAVARRDRKRRLNSFHHNRGDRHGRTEGTRTFFSRSIRRGLALSSPSPGGCRTKRIAFNSETVDVTDADSTGR